MTPHREEKEDKIGVDSDKGCDVNKTAEGKKQEESPT